MYNLWVIAGLKYRQRFAAKATTAENKKKQTDEAAIIADMIIEIEETEAYKALKETAKRKVQDQLRRKDYKMIIDQDDVNLLSWDGVMPFMGMDTDKMGVMYTYFSLYAHPSNVAVFQYGDLFEITKDDYTQMSNFNVATAIKLVSFFISDYIKLFPEVKSVFEKLPLIDQITINFHNKFIRNDGSVINDSLKSLG